LEEESVTAQSNAAGILVFPNPTNGMVNIELEEHQYEPTINLYLYSLSGSLVYSNQIRSNFNFDLGSFDIDPGIYILRLESITGVDTHKIIYTR
jgi:hypothetical protein